MSRLLALFGALGMGMLVACSSSIVDPSNGLTGGAPNGAGGRAATGGAAPSNGGIAATTLGGSASGGMSNAQAGSAIVGGASAQGGGQSLGGTGSGGAGNGGSAGAIAHGGGTAGGAGGAGGSAGQSSAGAAGLGGGAGAGSGCASGQTSCGGSCVDTKTNASHCGGCNQPCQSGLACTNGACACATGKSACSSGCVDLTSDAANCGACGTSCSGGRTCQASSCQCASGQTFCNDTTCSDTKTDAQNCGACGTKCTLGQACVAGTCTTGSGGPAADGCQGLAQNLTLSQIAVYQTVKVPIMQNGAEVAVASRNTDVVAGKDAVFRLFVTVGSGFSARSLSGRVFVDNGGAVDMYSAKVTVSATSQEAQLASTFQVTVPKDKITRTTQYQVEIVECATGSGSLQTPRFPATGGAALGARETGTVKIKVIPLSANSMVADTSTTALATYKAQFMAMYPITSIDMTVGDTLTVPDATDWTAMLDQVRAKRQSDAPASDIYYYGFLKPTTTLAQYCGNGCTAGIGYVVAGNSTQQAAQRAALGLAFADATSAQTMAHEVGHNHGRNHAPCVQGGTISGVDGNYPYTNGAVGVYGWDSRTSALIAPDRTDIMGYCNNKWISDYTYDGLLTRVATVNGAPMSVSIPLELVHPWRILLVDAKGPRWGIPVNDPAAPAGVAEMADVLDSAGQVIGKVQVFRTEVSDVSAFSFEVPPPEAGWHAVQVQGAAPIAFALP